MTSCSGRSRFDAVIDSELKMGRLPTVRFGDERNNSWRAAVNKMEIKRMTAPFDLRILHEPRQKAANQFCVYLFT